MRIAYGLDWKASLDPRVESPDHISCVDAEVEQSCGGETRRVPVVA
jgi:hypothetical protein